MDDDEQVRALVVRARAGENDAAGELMRSLYPLVAKIVRGYRPQQAAEEDLCQMIFVKVFTRLEQFAGKVPLSHWVSRIAVNECHNQLAAEKRRPEMREADLKPEQVALLQNLPGEHGEISPSEKFGVRDLVEKLVASLPPVERLIIDMMYLQGRSVEETRSATGWSSAAIKVRAFRARQKMRRQLERWQ